MLGVHLFAEAVLELASPCLTQPSEFPVSGITGMGYCGPPWGHRAQLGPLECFHLALALPGNYSTHSRPHEVILSGGSTEFHDFRFWQTGLSLLNLSEHFLFSCKSHPSTLLVFKVPSGEACRDGTPGGSSFCASPSSCRRWGPGLRASSLAMAVLC